MSTDSSQHHTQQDRPNPRVEVALVQGPGHTLRVSIIKTVAHAAADELGPVCIHRFYADRQAAADLALIFALKNSVRETVGDNTRYLVSVEALSDEV